MQSMESLKDYLKHSLIDLSAYIQKTKNKNINTVYNEDKRPDNATRIWISFDFNETEGKDFYANVDAWSKDKDIMAETWGNSVRTFLWENITTEPSIPSVAKYLVTKFIEYNILDGESFEDNKWQKTKDTSIYVFYRYKVNVEVNGKIEQKLNSNHFVLVLNAPIPHEDYFDEEPVEENEKRRIKFKRKVKIYKN